MLGESKTLAWGFAMAPNRLRALVCFSNYLHNKDTSILYQISLPFRSLQVKLANRENLDQNPLEQSELVTHCLSVPFSVTLNVQKF